MKSWFHVARTLLFTFSILFPCRAAFAQTEARVLIVTTSQSSLSGLPTRTGFQLADVLHPYYVFLQAGWTVDIASPAGGVAPVDPASVDSSDRWFAFSREDTVLQQKLSSTIPTARISPSAYDVVLFAGGHGALWDFLVDEASHGLTAKIFGKRGIVATIGQGAAVLLNTKLSTGEYIYAKRRITCATDEEERLRGINENLPYALETALRRGGGIIFKGAAHASNVIVEHRLITGQNSASARDLAKAVVEKWSELQQPEKK